MSLRVNGLMASTDFSFDDLVQAIEELEESDRRSNNAVKSVLRKTHGWRIANADLRAAVQQVRDSHAATAAEAAQSETPVDQHLTAEQPSDHHSAHQIEADELERQSRDQAEEVQLGMQLMLGIWEAELHTMPLLRLWASSKGLQQLVDELADW